MIVVAAAVTTTIGIIWAVTQQLGLSSTSYSKSFSFTQNKDFWLPGLEKVETSLLRNVTAAAAAASAIFPLPRITKESVVIMVMSARKNTEHRTAIRQTWSKGHDNVYFLVAAPCPYPPAQRTNSMDCQPRNHNYDIQQDGSEESQEYTKRLKWQHDQLLQEQAKHHDLIYLNNATESYRGLPHKLKEAYDWVLQQFDLGDEAANIRWLVKVDDDTVVRVATLQHMLSRYNSEVPMVIGKIVPKSPVWRDGKWAEFPKYKRNFYPYWPQGSCGHVVSRPVARYLAYYKHRLYNYQGEDTSVGIWLDESPYMRNHTLWIHTPYFINDGDCTNPDWIIMGHEIHAEKMKACYRQGDEVHQTRAWHDQRAEFSQQVQFVPNQ